MLIAELLNRTRLEKLLRDSYGNYCVQVSPLLPYPSFLHQLGIRPPWTTRNLVNVRSWSKAFGLSSPSFATRHTASASRTSCNVSKWTTTVDTIITSSLLSTWLSAIKVWAWVQRMAQAATCRIRPFKLRRSPMPTAARMACIRWAAPRRCRRKHSIASLTRSMAMFSRTPPATVTVPASHHRTRRQARSLRFRPTAALAPSLPLVSRTHTSSARLVMECKKRKFQGSKSHFSAADLPSICCNYDSNSVTLSVALHLIIASRYPAMACVFLAG